MKGLFSNQLLGANNKYGYDMPMIYGDIYIPWVAEGMNIRIGRFISLPDIEAQLAPDNYMFSHSLLYGYDPYTQMGIVATVKLNNQWTVQVGLTGGNDTAIWDPDALVSPLACIQVDLGRQRRFDLRLRQQHQWCGLPLQQRQPAGRHLDPQVHPDPQHGDRGLVHVERGRTACSGMTNQPGGLSLPFGCAPNLTPNFNGTSATTGFTQEWAIVNYINWQVTAKDAFSLRNEFFNDVNGQRTGTATRYYGIGLGMTHFFKQNVLLRPEMVYYQAMDNPRSSRAPSSRSLSRRST